MENTLSIDGILELMQNLQTQAIEKSTPIMIYGAGNFGKKVYSVLQQRGYKVLAFLDQKGGVEKFWDEIPIYQPVQNEISTLQRKNVCIIVAIHSRTFNVATIIEFLIQLGFTKILTPIEFQDTFPDEMGDNYWLTSRKNYLPWKNEINQCYSLLADEASRQLFIKIFQMRVLGDYSALPSPDLENQYFPKEIPPWRTPIRIIDCGAFDGDTLRFITNRGLQVDGVVAFEPDLNNFGKLKDFVASGWKSPALLMPCGVFSSTGQLRFTGNGDSNSKIGEMGEKIIQTTTIDDALHDFHPSLIKMDVEGSELDALIGAQKTILKERPGLAICVYHKPQDLWQIPLIIQSWHLDYKFYIRSHGYNSFETVMYAIPK